MNKSLLSTLILSFSVALMTSGCSSAPDELKNKVQELESENLQLKTKLQQADTELAALRNTAAPSKTAAATSETPAGSGESKSASSSVLSFSDLDDTPTKDMVLQLAQVGVFEGIGDKFDPNKPITRAQYIEWLYKSYNALEPTAKQLRFAPSVEQKFKDTPETHPQYKYIQALANAGYSIGYDDGTFKPDKPLTREEMLAIKVGVDVGKTLPPWRSQMETVWKFSDSKNVDEKFTGYVHQDFYVSGPHGSNIQRAFGKIGAFHPKDSVLRYEAAATLWQMGQFGDTQNTNVAAVLKDKNAKS